MLVDVLPGEALKRTGTVESKEGDPKVKTQQPRSESEIPKSRTERRPAKGEGQLISQSFRPLDRA